MKSIIPSDFPRVNVGSNDIFAIFGVIFRNIAQKEGKGAAFRTILCKFFSSLLHPGTVSVIMKSNLQVGTLAGESVQARFCTPEFFKGGNSDELPNPKWQ
ncbi:MAG: hypothetical protein LUD79_06600 [Oscillospiraceae bacterium]|nr:hypothetical protein [Oscillospiraceae bacterium]